MKNQREKLINQDHLITEGLEEEERRNIWENRRNNQ